MNLPHKEPSLSGDYVEDEGKYFRTHGITIQESIDDKKFEEFCNLKSNEDRIKFMYNLDIVHSIELPASPHKKTIHITKSYKDEGNVLFGKGDYKQAAKLYGLALIECPDTEEILCSVLFANRSAALYHNKEYERALQDIDLALGLPYPESFKHKALERKARCYLALDDLQNAILMFKQCMPALSQSDLSPQSRQKKETDIAIMISLLTKTLEKNNKVEKRSVSLKSELPPVPALAADEQNEKYPSASKLVRFISTASEGRFAVANSDIDPGQVLVTEKANSATLLFEYSKSHCQHCFVRVIYPVPCPHCPNVVFCTTKCRNHALNTYHKYECSFLGALCTCGVSIVCFLAVRLIAQKGLKYFLNIKQTLSDNIEETSVYNAADYRTVYHLCSHTDRRSHTNLFQRSVIAVVLLRFLQRAKFFATEPNKTLTEEESFIGGLILHNLQVLQFNAHEIAELQYDVDYPKDINRAKSQFIGGGIFPTLALFNHSCEPGIVRYFSGTNVIVKSVKPITANGIIAENYGPIYTQVKREIRQSELQSRYWFECKCEPCTENWPTFEQMTTDILPFKCIQSQGCSGVIMVGTNTEEFMFPCPKCTEMICIFGSLRTLHDTESMFNKGERLMKNQDYGEALKIFIKILKILSNILKPPYKDFCLCQQKIRSCMLTFGNVYPNSNIRKLT